MRAIFIVMLITLIPLVIHAEIQSNAGEYGFKFLQIPISPIAAALAGNGIYANNYPGAFVFNPAANLMGENFNLSVNHTLWLVDTNCTQIVYSKGDRNKHFGLTARVLDNGQLDTRDDTGAIIGNFHPYDASLMTNIAYRIMPSHMIGVNLGMLYEKLDTASSYGLNADFGYMYLPPITNTTLFASVRNIGATSRMNEEAIKLPLTYEAGLGYTLPFETNVASAQVAVNKAADTNIHATISTELALWQILSLRLGYKASYDEEGLTAGMGINWNSLGLNYGWASFSDRLNDTHSLGLTYNF